MSDKSRLVLITGASSGIGESLASQWLETGFSVIGTSRSLERLESLQEKFGHSFYAHKLDVADRDSVQSVVERLPQNWQSIDILVNNAGSDIGGHQPFGTGDLTDWMNTIDVNVNGVIAVTKAVLSGMIRRNHGDIVNIGSTSGINPVPTTPVYSASKHAINGFSESLRLELEDYDIRVMQILPGMVKTQFAASRFRDATKGDELYDSYGKWLYPDDVAKFIVFALQQPRHVVIPQLVIVPKPI